MLVALLALTSCDVLTGPDRRFSDDAVDYYRQVALGAEYGDLSPVVHKWTEELSVFVSGEPVPADREELDHVIGELNRLVAVPAIERVSRRELANVEVHFAPESTFADVLPQYVSGNRGFFWFWTGDSNEIVQAMILIDNTDATSQLERDHLIREELTQALGLPNDPPAYSESIFGPGGPTPTEYATIDRTVLEIHGLPDIQPGMTGEEVRDVLR